MKDMSETRHGGLNLISTFLLLSEINFYKSVLKIALMNYRL